MSKNKKNEKKASTPPEYHLLHPSPSAAFEHLTTMLNILEMMPHRAMIFFEVLPRWHEFLVEQDLLDEEEREPLGAEITRRLSPFINQLADSGEDLSFKRAQDPESK